MRRAERCTARETRACGSRAARAPSFFGTGNAFNGRNPSDQRLATQAGVTDLPIACTLTSAELQSRGAQLLPGLVARAIGRVPVTNGVRWSFAPVEGLLAELARVIDAERQCCRFLRFAVAAEADGGPVSLEVTGPPG